MESRFLSRIPLSVSNRQKNERTFPRDPLTTITLNQLNQRFGVSVTNTNQCGTFPKNACSKCSKCSISHKPPLTAPPTKPLLDDYKGRFKNLLEKYEILNKKLSAAQAELEGYKDKNVFLGNKLTVADAELKSIRQDLKRIKARNKTNELTIEILERKISELKVHAAECEEGPFLSRFGRSIRPPIKYQSNSS